MAREFRPGIDVLIESHPDWIQDRRVGLVSHLAAVGHDGRSSAEILCECGLCRVNSLMGPEHGYFGGAGAGAAVRATIHPFLKIPVHSLYGKTRKPGAAMLRDLDLVVVDMQDLGARCYTYVSTLLCVLEACAEAGKTVVVADRPTPLPRVVDGPCLDRNFASFVGLAPLPMNYGMTQGETALFLKSELDLNLDLKVAPMHGYHRDTPPGKGWGPWIPPSPAIRSWESAFCFTSTVFTEALPVVDNGRTGPLPFQVVGSRGLDGERLSATLSDLQLPGVSFVRHPYRLDSGRAGGIVKGIRIVVNSPTVFRPASTGISILWAIQKIKRGTGIWKSRGARQGFFDKLYGGSGVRKLLKSGANPKTIADGWKKELAAFRRKRRQFLLYPTHPGSEAGIKDVKSDI